MSDTATVTEIILHCQKQIKKNDGEEKLLHYLGRLRRLRIKVKDLVDTGIGRTVNQLSRLDGIVGQEALNLVAEWKALVEAEKSSSEASDSSSHDEEEEDEEQDDEGTLHIIDHGEVDQDKTVGVDAEVKNHNGYNVSRHSHSRSRSPPPVPSNSNYVNDSEYDVDHNPSTSSDDDKDDAVPSSLSQRVKSEPESPVRSREDSPEIKRHGHGNRDKCTNGNKYEVEENKNKHREKGKDKFKKYESSKMEHQEKSHSFSSTSNSRKSHHHKTTPSKSSDSSTSPESSSMSENDDYRCPVDPLPVKVKVEKPVVKEERKSHSSRHGKNGSHEYKQSDRHSSSNRHSTSNSSHDKYNGASRDHTKKYKEHKKRDTDRDSGFGANHEIVASVKSEHLSSENDDEEDMLSSRPSSSRIANGNYHSLDSSVKVKIEHSSENKKSDNHKDRDKSKSKDRKKIESTSSKRDKEESKSHRHGHSESSKHQNKKDDRRSKHKRKSDEDLLKSETELKKVKLEPKVEKKKKPQLVPTLSVEIDSTSGVNFADVLSCLDQKMSTSSSSSRKKDKPKGNSGSPNSKSSSQASISASIAACSSKSKRTAHEDKRSIRSSSSKIVLQNNKTNNNMKPKSVILPTSSLSSSSVALISPNYKPSAVARIMAVAPMPVPKPYVSLPPKEILSSLRPDFQGFSSYPVHEGENRLETDRRAHEDALSTMISSRNQRTKVYSGVKSGICGSIPKLFDLCIRVIQENINDLGYTGGVPYDILKPVLDRATADQLFHVENYNPYLIENTDDLWKFHCSKVFRGKLPQELESWRELYTRCVDERKARFQTLKNKVKNNQETAVPQARAKLAYVDTTAGPRFHRTKAETIKNGMKTLKTREEKGVKRTHGSSASAGGSGSSQNVTIEEASVIIPADSKAGSAPAPREREPSSTASAKKHKKAPLMQKTMKIIKTLFRR